MMNNSNQLIQYYNKSIGKLIVIDSQTGFSCYRSLDDINSCQGLGSSQITNQLTNQLIVNSNTQTNQTKHSFMAQNECKPIGDTLSAMKSENTTNSNSNNNNNSNNAFPLRHDMRIDVSVKLEKWFLSNGNIRVIGQVDHKFIICLLVKQNLLLAFDQHAVHERIRYESLMRNAFDNSANIKSIRVLPPIDISLDSPELKQSFDTYRNQIKSLVGFELKEDSKKNNYLVTQIPECLERSLDCDIIVDVIKEALIILKESNGTTRIRLTPKLLELLKSKACKGSIRFGDALKLHDCLKLINALIQCKVSFRCAHGRTSVAPLLYLPQKFN